MFTFTQLVSQCFQSPSRWIVWRYGLGLFACLPGLVWAEIDWETSGFLKANSAYFTRPGTVVGGLTEHAVGDLSQFTMAANLLVNAQFQSHLSAHAQFNGMYYGEGGESKPLHGHLNYSQQDYLRELYLDYTVEEIKFRLGKQQLVWGTADGIKLLDIVNPTDYREFSQNTQEDARIPVWMLSAERNFGDDYNLQFVLSEARSNRIPGLRDGGEPGQPFVTQGVDSLTGPFNGFMAITPALGQVASAFQRLALAASQGQAATLQAVGGDGFTVQDFVNGSSPFCPPSQDCAALLNQIAQDPAQGGNAYRTNLVSSQFDAAHPDSAFEYLAHTRFSSFDSFAGAQSRYQRDLPSGELNTGLRFKGNLANRLNYSLHYFYHDDANPTVRLHWEDAQGQPLSAELRQDQNGQPNTLQLRRADGRVFQAADALHPNDGQAVLVFRESTARVHSLGASVDTTVDTAGLGAVVLRGEFLYDQGTQVPVVDRAALAVGHLTQALHPEEADFFKYVLGADITLWTNLMLSVQFIQFYNLDYLDEAGVGEHSGRYTADPATLHLSNDLQAGRRVKNFGTLLLSKPFGQTQQGRIDNLTLYEEGGGLWNRLAVEYAFTDALLGSLAWNHYGGNRHTSFGQLHAASSLQLGLKYLFW